MDRRVMPVGVQDFEDLRRKGYIYMWTRPSMSGILQIAARVFFCRVRDGLERAFLLLRLKATFVAEKIFSKDCTYMIKKKSRRHTMAPGWGRFVLEKLLIILKSGISIYMTL